MRSSGAPAPVHMHLMRFASCAWLTTVSASYDFDGRTALVTGAASGIGRQIAYDLLRSGARVLAADRDASGLQQYADQPLATPVECDLADVAAIASAFEQAGDVDMLVNAAGMRSRLLSRRAH